jgi:hypothetical protein
MTVYFWLSALLSMLCMFSFDVTLLFLLYFYFCIPPYLRISIF